MRWQDNASCRPDGPHNVSAEAWITEGDGLEAQLLRAAARRVCKHCPVAEQCYRDAVDNRATVGVWGGVRFGAHTAERAHARIAAARRAARRAAA